MPMTDPMDALTKLQQALDARIVSLDRCDLHSDLRIIVDQPNGTPRFTYVLLNGSRVSAIAIFALTEPIEGLQCFQVGYAVSEADRKRGLGTSVLAKGIDELKNGFSRTPLKEFFLEAVVSISNDGSNRIAQRLLSDSPNSIKDGFSGEDAFQYLRKLSCVA